MKHRKIVGKVGDLCEEITEVQDIAMLRMNCMYKKEST
jgi:hypothetical protein